MTKIIHYLALALVATLTLSACDDTETYTEKRERENAAINAYISLNGIKTISEAEFESAGYQTNVATNEYVLFDGTGVYLQVVNKGCGQPVKNGETATALCRFTEVNLLADTLVLTNNSIKYSSAPDKLTVTNTSGSYQGSFVSGRMYSIYGAAVPNGWLAALPYINLGRPVSEDDEIAHIRLIVPAEQGQQYASQNVYPYYYDLTLQRGL